MDKRKRDNVIIEVSNVAMLIICVLFSIAMTTGIIFAITLLSQLLRGVAWNIRGLSQRGK